MSLNLERFKTTALFSLLFILIPLWNIPHTIAGRYICEGLLLVLFFTNKLNWKLFFQENKALALFFAYLFLQLIFFSRDYQAAFSNFRAEWMHFILFSIIGAGAGLFLGKKDSNKTLLFLGVAFSIPLYIHLILFAIKAIATHEIPWRYLGLSEIHGDLGYTALQATIFLMTLCVYQKKFNLRKLSLIFLLIPCIVSPVLAKSRGGILFVIATIIFIFIVDSINQNKGKVQYFKFLVRGALALTLCLSVYLIGVNTDPTRWNGVASRVSLSLKGNPGEIYCQGIGSLEDTLKREGTQITTSIQKSLDSIVDGDGARVMAARSGAELTLQSPMGIDQSKQAYQQAITKQCNGAPAIFISHTHNAWIDTALAIGIPGAALLFITLLTYMVRGRNALNTNISPIAPYGMALFATSFLWTIRGLLDSVQRDQMLEMQAFVLAMLLGIIVARKKGLSQG